MVHDTTSRQPGCRLRNAATSVTSRCTSPTLTPWNHATGWPSWSGTLTRGDNLAVRFEVTDGNKTVPVTYVGILPDLFREGQGVVTEGALEPGGTFRADNVLAKHDETYMPKEVADALKKQGHWKTEGGYGLAGSSKESAK